MTINAEVPGEVTTEDLIVPGVYEDLLDDPPILYTSYVPIIFEFQKPSWDNLNLNWSEIVNCTDAETTQVATLCPTGYYLEEITRNLTHIFNTEFLFQAGLSVGKRKPYSNVAQSIVDSLSCDEIHPHFKAGLSGVIDVESYFSELNACPLIREILINQTLTARDMPFFKPLFDKTLAAYNKSWASHVQVEDRIISSALLVDFYAAIKGILLGNFLLDNERWEDAFGSCAEHQLPRMIINESDLRSILKTVGERLMEYKYEPSIPLDQIFKLYDLKLTDCAFTTRQTYLIRLLIPIKLPDVNSFRLYNLLPLPSIFKTDLGYKLCELTNIPLQQIQSTKDNERHPVSCQDTDYPLCYVSITTDTVVQTLDYAFECTRALAKNDISKNILKYCKSRLQCSLLDTQDAPYYKRLTSDTVFISVIYEFRDRFNLSIWCKDKQLQSLDVTKNSTEFLITLPFGCEIRDSKQKVFIPSAPYKNSTAVRNPNLHKFSLPDVILQPKYLLPNESAIILTELKTRMQKLEVALEEATQQSLSALSNRGLYVALVILLLIIVAVLFLWGLQLWRWKRSTLRTRASYVMFDQAPILQDDAAL
ncbi:unnamed protein product [Allacma fusca]|uniref:Uncharacterized protein n=1 Tax=Allacma fusca TaxID=39272 RepID=A0A8J2PGQ1_9HEXA|nr:unnamed protein product [Allacma fusca]